MTKQQEIKALDAMIKMFGDDSYIGPWLKKHYFDIVWCINNDLGIDVVLDYNARSRQANNNT